METYVKRLTYKNTYAIIQLPKGNEKQETPKIKFTWKDKEDETK